ncbi:hypothetical protein llap_13443 [Limosa lapponica baueri]|uniref:Uncharacterized protein n=1 Tax=Limosa lapponica baueri TaxID=1758121 RepID=A0A2I0TR95_LIMLA|nr:hypothetical protein llap_13443 [Limosa lapponica baueri]
MSGSPVYGVLPNCRHARCTVPRVMFLDAERAGSPLLKPAPALLVKSPGTKRYIKMLSATAEDKRTRGNGLKLRQAMALGIWISDLHGARNFEGSE